MNQPQQGQEEADYEEQEQEVAEAVRYHSSELCKIVEASEAIGLHNQITVHAQDGSPFIEFDLHIKRRKVGARRAAAWNRTFVGYALAILPTLLASAVAIHIGLPVWKSLLIMSLTIALALCITVTAIRYTLD